MAFELRPADGNLASAHEVERLLREEFGYLICDPEEGLAQARARATWIEQAPARVFLGLHKEALEMAEHLRTLPSGEARAIEFGDDATRTLRIVVMPGDTIKFGFASSEEQASARPMVGGLRALAIANGREGDPSEHDRRISGMRRVFAPRPSVGVAKIESRTGTG
jgi:hypothetical protein